MKLSKTQEEVITVLENAHSRALERHSGGFWTYPGCSAKNEEEAEKEAFRQIPKWYVGWSTVKSLIDKGLARITKRATNQQGAFPILVEVFTDRVEFSRVVDSLEEAMEHNNPEAIKYWEEEADQERRRLIKP